MDETYLIRWLWVYRLAAIGIFCVLSYACWRTIRGIVVSTKEIRKLREEIRQLKREI